jgi:hypothetical protein
VVLVGYERWLQLKLGCGAVQHRQQRQRRKNGTKREKLGMRHLCQPMLLHSPAAAKSTNHHTSIPPNI